jgi:uracil-DNA glycosylase family 4
MADAIGVLIAPNLTFGVSDTPAVYGFSTEEREIIQKIWRAAAIDSDDFYITSSVACKGDATPQTIEACASRLTDTIVAISPKLVVCSGIQALNAFFGKDMTGTEKGWVKGSPYYEVFYTYNLSQYVQYKKDNVTGWEDVANEIFNHWKEIAEYIKSIKS